PVVRDQRRRLGVIGAQPLAHRLGIVVGAALERRAAAFVANSRRGGLLELVMVPLAAGGAGVTAGHAADHRLVVHLEADRGTDTAAFGGEKRVERPRLPRRAREAVEDDTPGHVGL